MGREKRYFHLFRLGITPRMGGEKLILVYERMGTDPVGITPHGRGKSYRVYTRLCGRGDHPA